MSETPQRYTERILGYVADWPPYDQARWAITGHYERRDPWKSIEQLRVLREANLALLDSLAPEQWKHVGMHSERAAESIERIVHMCAGHDLNHMRQTEQILERTSDR